MRALFWLQLHNVSQKPELSEEKKKKRDSKKK